MSLKSVKREPNALQRWARETVTELRRVSWPTREQAVHLTIVVLIVMLVAGAILGSLDFLFERLFIVLLGR